MTIPDDDTHFIHTEYNWIVSLFEWPHSEASDDLATSRAFLQQRLDNVASYPEPESGSTGYQANGKNDRKRPRKGGMHMRNNETCASSRIVRAISIRPCSIILVISVRTPSIITQLFVHPPLVRVRNCRSSSDGGRERGRRRRGSSSDRGTADGLSVNGLPDRTFPAPTARLWCLRPVVCKLNQSCECGTENKKNVCACVSVCTCTFVCVCLRAFTICACTCVFKWYEHSIYVFKQIYVYWCNIYIAYAYIQIMWSIIYVYLNKHMASNHMYMAYICAFKRRSTLYKCFQWNICIQIIKNWSKYIYSGDVEQRTCVFK